MIFRAKKIRLNSKDEPSISKNERVTAIFVSQVVAKSQIHKISKSQQSRALKLNLGTPGLIGLRLKFDKNLNYVKR